MRAFRGWGSELGPTSLEDQPPHGRSAGGGAGSARLDAHVGRDKTAAVGKRPRLGVRLRVERFEEVFDHKSRAAEQADERAEPFEVEVWQSVEVRWVDGQHSRHLLGLEVIRFHEVLGLDEVVGLDQQDDAALKPSGAAP